MQRQSIFIAIIIGLVLIVVGTYIYLQSKSNGSEMVNTIPNPNPFGNPAGNIPVPTTTTTQSTNRISLTLRDDSIITVPNFIPKNQPPWANATSTGWQIAGSEQAGSSGVGYHILFYPQQSYFLISILDEPIGEKRLNAESDLETRLGLSPDNICKLNVQVFVMGAVNATYAGRDIGLSFCPGSTKL